MTYEEARQFLSEVSAKGSRPGLDSIRTFLKELGDPQDELKFVHVAGTNGKGSVMSYLEDILTDSGFRVGRYLSPVLHEYEERIRVNGVCIEKQQVASLTGRLKKIYEDLAGRGELLPTIFELETAMSFLFFREQRCDLVLLETGMGGTLDATNIIRTGILEVITSISMDHMQFLGDTLEKIALQKAGIIKPGTVVVSAPQEPEAERVLRQEAFRNKAVFRRADVSRLRDVSYGLSCQTLSYGEHCGVKIHMAGVHQIENAMTALEAVDVLRSLGWTIPESAVLSGMERCRFAGRLEILGERPLFVIDGAHNPGAAEVLMRSVDLYFPKQRLIYIFGVFSDKEYDTIIEMTMKRADRILTVQAKDNPRAMDAAALADRIRPVNPKVSCIGEVSRAVELALELAHPEDIVLVFGSLAFLWEAADAYRQITGQAS